jgi:cell division septum initiation protein DivIVA
VGERADPLRDDAFDEAAAGGWDADDATEPTLIAAEIDQTRSELSQTIDAIQDRLAPERLTEQAIGAATDVTEQARDATKDVVTYAIDEAKTAVRELADQATAAVRGATIGRVEQVTAETRDMVEDAGSGLWATIRSNPVPAALAAIGIGWLWTHRADGGSAQRMRGYADRDLAWSSGANARDWQAGYGRGAADWPASNRWSSSDQGMAGQVVDQAQQAAGHVADQAQQAAGQVVDQVQAAAGQVMGQAQQTAEQIVGQVQDTTGQVRQQAQGAFWQLLETNPLVVGALGAVVGGLAALALPETEPENQVLGDVRDRVLDQAQAVVGQTVDAVQQVAGTAAAAAVETAQTQAQAMRPDAGRSGTASSA